MKRQIALDTETTGKCDDGTPGDHRVIEIGCVEIIDRKITKRNLRFLINPQRPIDQEAFNVHGISNQMLEDKPVFAQIADEFIDFIKGAELLIHNAKFDVSFLDNEFLIIGKNLHIKDICTITDTLKLAQIYQPNALKNLNNLCKIYNIDTSSRTLHGALLDAKLLADVYLAMTRSQSSLDFDNFEDSSQAKPADSQEIINSSVFTPIKVDDDSFSKHLEYMIDLSVKNTISNNNEQYYKSLWDDALNQKVLVQNENEDKKAYGKRVDEYKKQLFQTLIQQGELKDRYQ